MAIELTTKMQPTMRLIKHPKPSVTDDAKRDDINPLQIISETELPSFRERISREIRSASARRKPVGIDSTFLPYWLSLAYLAFTASAVGPRMGSRCDLNICALSLVRLIVTTSGHFRSINIQSTFHPVVDL